jgi:hypothetical protein
MDLIRLDNYRERKGQLPHGAGRPEPCTAQRITEAVNNYLMRKLQIARLKELQPVSPPRDLRLVKRTD